MISSAKRTQIIIVLPQNIEFTYYEYGLQTELLKDNIHEILGHNTGKLIPNNYVLPFITFEITDTEIGEQVKISSNFTFERGNYNGNNDYSNPFFKDMLTFSKLINKCTTIRVKKRGEEFTIEDDRSDIIITSLNLKTNDNLVDFLVSTKLVKSNKSEIPKWMEQVEFNNDKELEDEIKHQNYNIEKATDAIQLTEKLIKKNNKYKSILYENGVELENVVKEMLEEIFSINLSNFEDQKKEDFLFEIEGMVVIGEIKGKNEAVKK